ncbi:MAG: hypothetical protein COV67_10670, partial [Nitrospinae bacterium CG11_big_fil_rev_8_21_14_0_20_56_8]
MAMPYQTGKKDIASGVLLLGITGLLIGFVVHSGWLMLVAGLLGAIVGGFVGWVGGRRYMIIVCLGALAGGSIGYTSGDTDIIIISA